MVVKIILLILCPYRKCRNAVHCHVDCSFMSIFFSYLTLSCIMLPVWLVFLPSNYIAQIYQFPLFNRVDHPITFFIRITHLFLSTFQSKNFQFIAVQSNFKPKFKYQAQIPVAVQTFHFHEWWEQSNNGSICTTNQRQLFLLSFIILFAVFLEMQEMIDFIKIIFNNECFRIFAKNLFQMMSQTLYKLNFPPPKFVYKYFKISTVHPSLYIQSEFRIDAWLLSLYDFAIQYNKTKRDCQ